MNAPTPRLRALCFTLLTALACGLPAVSQEAASPSYNIELVVFRAPSAQGITENWSAEAGSSNIVVGEEASSGSSQVGRFVGMIPSGSYQLTDIESKLRSSGAYVPIAHVAWSQSA